MRTLRENDKGPDVLAMTQHLVDVGLMEFPQATFDTDVRMALEAWQHHGRDPRGRALKVDGVYGDMTRNSLEASPEDLYWPAPEIVDRDVEAPNHFLQAVLAYAKVELVRGAGEQGGNNRGPDVDKYHRTQGSHWAWCAAFTSWCFWSAAKKLGYDMPFDYTGGAQNILKQFREKGWAYTPTHENPPQPGDVVVWWRGVTKTWKGHVGIVYAFENGVVYVIEGNVGRYPAKVAMFSYSLEEMPKLLGMGRVPDMTPV